MKKVISISIITILYLFSILQVFNLFVADIYFASSRQLFEKKAYDQALQHAIDSIRLNANEPSYYRQAARAYLGIGDLNFTLSNLNKAQRLNDKNLTTLRNALPIYFAIAKSNDAYLGNALNYYNDLKNKYPNDLGVLADIAKYETELGAEQNYNETVEMVKNLRPDILEWHPSFTN